MRQEEKISGGDWRERVATVGVSWPVNRKCCLFGTLFVQRVTSGVEWTFLDSSDASYQ